MSYWGLSLSRGNGSSKQPCATASTTRSFPTLPVGTVVLVGDYRLSGPYTQDNLTIFLVHGAETLPAMKFLTLEQALREQKAIVNETGSVNRLTIENQSSDVEVFVQSGDIVKGGKEDRTLPYDSLIQVKSGQVPIDSFCVEQSRWSKRGDESSDKFSSSSNNLGISDMKRAAMSPRSGSSQTAVWQNVAKTQERLSKKLGSSVKADASGSSLQLTLENPAVVEAIARYQTLRPIADQHDDAIGYVAVVNGRVVSADVYASRALFHQLWPKLLDGSGLEAFIESDADRSADPANEDAVRAFLREAEEGKASGEAITGRTYVQVRTAKQTMLLESCDRSRDNLVLHRSFLTRRAD